MIRNTKPKLWIETEKPPQLAQDETVTPAHSGAELRRKDSSMSKFDDKQIDIAIGSQVIHTPSGQTPSHGADAPNVSPKGATPAGGSKQVVLLNGLRVTNPA
jgi:hypothetical protein